MPGCVHAHMRFTQSVSAWDGRNVRRGQSNFEEKLLLSVPQFRNKQPRRGRGEEVVTFHQCSLLRKENYLASKLFSSAAARSTPTPTRCRSCSFGKTMNPGKCIREDYWCHTYTHTHKCARCCCCNRTIALCIKTHSPHTSFQPSSANHTKKKLLRTLSRDFVAA